MSVARYCVVTFKAPLTEETCHTYFHCLEEYSEQIEVEMFYSHWEVTGYKKELCVYIKKIQEGNHEPVLRLKAQIVGQ